MNKIFIRAISGTVYVSLIIGSLIFSKVSFSLLFFFFNIVAVYEFIRFKENNHRSALLAICISGATYMAHYLWVAQILAVKYMWLFALLPVIFSLITLFTNKKTPHIQIANNLLALLYITLPLMLLNQLNFRSTGNNFPWLVFIVFILIWVNDTFAYLTGMAFGKHKIFERVSPKKSWEGFFGGVLFSVITAWFFFPLVPIENRISWLILSVFIAVAAVMGDFVESMFKRDAGVKDSGKLIPGHGGILDRIDSLLFVFPIVFVFLQLF